MLENVSPRKFSSLPGARNVALLSLFRRHRWPTLSKPEKVSHSRSNDKCSLLRLNARRGAPVSGTSGTTPRFRLNVPFEAPSVEHANIQKKLFFASLTGRKKFFGRGNKMIAGGVTVFFTGATPGLERGPGL